MDYDESDEDSDEEGTSAIISCEPQNEQSSSNKTDSSEDVSNASIVSENGCNSNGIDDCQFLENTNNHTRIFNLKKLSS